MLELKPNCERCNKELQQDDDEAYICSYECTFCEECCQSDLDFTCPNCFGALVKRPPRTAENPEFNSS